MKILKQTPGEITVRSDISWTSAAGGMFIQACVLFALVYTIRLYVGDTSGEIKFHYILIMLVANLVCYYFCLHAQVTKNINRVTISPDGITRKTLLRSRHFPAAMIVKARLVYMFSKGSRGSESTHILELLAELKDGWEVITFYMENTYWEDADEAVYNDMMAVLIANNYSEPGDYDDE